MIKDSTMQELWAAVEEIRQRIETLEQGDNSLDEVSVEVSEEVSPEIMFDFVASMTSNRKTFHLRGCKFTRGFMATEGGYRVFATYAEAVSAGFVPCRICWA